MRRKGQRVRFFDVRDRQVGPEQKNVAPALLYAAHMGWSDLTGPPIRYDYDQNASVVSKRESLLRLMRDGWYIGGVGSSGRTFELFHDEHPLEIRFARYGLVRDLFDEGVLVKTVESNYWEYAKLVLAESMTPNSGAYHYVWPLTREGKPLGGEGPWGPMTLASAKTFARIGATEGKHDRAVTTTLSPVNKGFKIVRVYEAGTGERLV
jgi:hypothetical protein